MNNPTALVDPSGLHEVTIGNCTWDVFTTQAGDGPVETNWEFEGCTGEGNFFSATGIGGSIGSVGGGGARGGGTRAPGAATNNSNCGTPSVFPHSIAVVGSTEAIAGIAATGASAQQTVSPVFVSTSGNVGIFTSTSTFANFGSQYAANVPQRDTPIAFGGDIGLGAGVMISNATNASQVSGPFETYTLSIPAVSLSFSFGNGIWELQATLGPQFGLSHTYSTSNTVVNSNNQPCRQGG